MREIAKYRATVKILQAAMNNAYPFPYKAYKQGADHRRNLLDTTVRDLCKRYEYMYGIFEISSLHIDSRLPKTC